MKGGDSVISHPKLGSGPAPTKTLRQCARAEGVASGSIFSVSPVWDNGYANDLGPQSGNLLWRIEYSGEFGVDMRKL